MFIRVLSVGLGGAIGATARFLVSKGVQRIMGGQFPYGTLTVNVLGSFLLGVFAVLIVETGSVSLEWRLMVTTGMLGAFTTFSTFSYESVSLLREGFYLAFAGNILGSVVFCLSAVTLGILVGHFLSFLVFVLS